MRSWPHLGDGSYAPGSFRPQASFWLMQSNPQGWYISRTQHEKLNFLVKFNFDSATLLKLLWGVTLQHVHSYYQKYFQDGWVDRCEHTIMPQHSGYPQFIVNNSRYTKGGLYLAQWLSSEIKLKEHTVQDGKHHCAAFPSYVWLLWISTNPCTVGWLLSWSLRITLS